MKDSDQISPAQLLELQTALKGVTTMVEQLTERLHETPLPVEARFYDVNDLMVIFGKSKPTIMRMTKSGALPGKRLGGSLVYLRKDIDTMVENLPAAEGD